MIDTSSNNVDKSEHYTPPNSFFASKKRKHRDFEQSNREAMNGQESMSISFNEQNGLMQRIKRLKIAETHQPQ